MKQETNSSSEKHKKIRLISTWKVSCLSWNWKLLSHVWILQARILEKIAFPFTRGSSWPRDRTRIAGRGFTLWATVSTQQMFMDLNLVTDFEQHWWLCTSLHRYLSWIIQKGSTLPPARKGYLRVPGFLLWLSEIFGFSDLPSQMS